MAKESCRYCNTFRTATRRSRVDLGEEKGVHMRWCDSVGRLVRRKRGACPHFTLAKFFFCQNNKYWLTFKVCLHRYSKGHPRCDLCAEVDTIIDMLRGRKNGKKQKLIRRRVNEHGKKQKLIRRRVNEQRPGGERGDTGSP